MSQSHPSVTPEEVEAHTRSLWNLWNTDDPEQIVKVYTGGKGFGYRTRPAREDYGDKVDYRPIVEQWLASLDYYSIVLDDVQTLAYGNVGIAWGLYHEDFQKVGGQPERVDGRFSQTFVKENGEWSMLFYHRDMTPFDADGKYVPPAGG